MPSRGHRSSAARGDLRPSGLPGGRQVVQEAVAGDAENMRRRNPLRPDIGAPHPARGAVPPGEQRLPPLAFGPFPVVIACRAGARRRRVVGVARRRAATCSRPGFQLACSIYAADSRVRPGGHFHGRGRVFHSRTGRRPLRNEGAQLGFEHGEARNRVLQVGKRRGGANPVIEDGGPVGPFVAVGVDPSLVFGAVSQGADGALEAAALASRGVPCGVLGVLAALLLLQFGDERSERREVDAVGEDDAPGVGVALSGAAVVGGVVPAEGAEFVEAAFEAPDLAFSDFEASRGGGDGGVGDGPCAGSPVAIACVGDLEGEIVDLAPVHADASAGALDEANQFEPVHAVGEAFEGVGGASGGDTGVGRVARPARLCVRHGVPRGDGRAVGKRPRGSVRQNAILPLTAVASAAA